MPDTVRSVTPYLYYRRCTGGDRVSETLGFDVVSRYQGDDRAVMPSELRLEKGRVIVSSFVESAGEGANGGNRSACTRRSG